MIEMYHDWIGNPDKHPKGPTNLPKTVIDSIRLDAEDFMFFDPRKLIEEYDRLVNVAKDTGDNVTAVADLGETRNHLINWTGDAATAFKRQLDLMQEYCERMQTNITQAMLGLLLADQLAIHARADCLSLLEATIAAAEHEIDEESKRNIVATVSVLENVVDSVLQVDSKSLVSGALDLSVKIGSTVAQRAIEGAWSANHRRAS